MDGEVWFMPYIDTYDRRGQLWRNHIYWVAYRDRPVPDAKVAIYPFKRAFVVGATSTDVQSGQGTMCYLPGIETPERECWYINMDAVDKNFFARDVAARRGALSAVTARRSDTERLARLDVGRASSFRCAIHGKKTARSLLAGRIDHFDHSRLRGPPS